MPEEVDMGFNSIGVVCVCEIKSGAAMATAGTTNKETVDKSKFRIAILPIISKLKSISKKYDTLIY